MNGEAKPVFPVRFFMDRYYIQELLNDKVKAVSNFKKLSHIHTRSIHYPFNHNVMFDECFKILTKNNKERIGQALLGICHPLTPPSFLDCEKDFESKVIRYCINLAAKKTYKVLVLTSGKQHAKYISNSHYKDKSIKNAIKFIYGENALELLDVVSGI